MTIVPRTYSTRERVLFALMLPLGLAGVALLGYVVVTDPDAPRSPLWWIAGLGLVSGLVVCARIVLTSRAGRALEQDAFDALRGRRLPPE